MPLSPEEDAAAKALSITVNEGKKVKALKEMEGWEILSKRLQLVREQALERVLEQKVVADLPLVLGVAKGINLVLNVLEVIIVEGEQANAQLQELFRVVEDAAREPSREPPVYRRTHVGRG
jgi:hypothetical protein